MLAASSASFSAMRFLSRYCHAVQTLWEGVVGTMAGTGVSFAVYPAEGHAAMPDYGTRQGVPSGIVRGAGLLQGALPIEQPAFCASCAAESVR